uniref:Uncharacterized protein n=1 Tax=Noctiluca scintillans TaxID=2966 RepID=A0A7S1FA46_NOCSC
MAKFFQAATAVLRKKLPESAVTSAKDGAGTVARGAKRVHNAIQSKLFEGEAPTLYRFRGNKYAHCYGAPNRGANKSMQHLMPYFTTGILVSLAVFLIGFPIYFQRNYEASKRHYEKFVREHDKADHLGRQFDRGRYSEMARDVPRQSQ